MLTYHTFISWWYCYALNSCVSVDTEKIMMSLLMNIIRNQNRYLAHSVCFYCLICHWKADLILLPLIVLKLFTLIFIYLLNHDSDDRMIVLCHTSNQQLFQPMLSSEVTKYGFTSIQWVKYSISIRHSPICRTASKMITYSFIYSQAFDFISI